MDARRLRALRPSSRRQRRRALGSAAGGRGPARVASVCPREPQSVAVHRRSRVARFACGAAGQRRELEPRERFGAADDGQPQRRCDVGLAFGPRERSACCVARAGCAGAPRAARGGDHRERSEDADRAVARGSRRTPAAGRGRRCARRGRRSDVAHRRVDDAVARERGLAARVVDARRVFAADPRVTRSCDAAVARAAHRARLLVCPEHIRRGDSRAEHYRGEPRESYSHRGRILP